MRSAAVVLLSLLAWICAAASPAAAKAALARRPAQGAVAVRVLSSAPTLVSGGEALVEIVGVTGHAGADLRVDLDGRDVTSAFALRPNGRMMGVLEGLHEGPNRLTVREGGREGAALDLINHAVGGPMIYAPQVQPWRCDPGATDAACNRPVSFRLLYRSNDPARAGLLPYDPAHPPTDVATATVREGVTVPFIVRVETGVIDRDYYDIATLYDPAKPWRPWSPQAGWNGKVVVTHGAGWGFGYGQLNTVAGAGVLNSDLLGRGYALMSTALADNGHDGNLAVQAEAMTMLKAHFIATYGEMSATIGMGGSGGALAQYWVANAYPGLYDGLVVSYSFPDAGTAGVEAEDCALLRGYFSAPTRWAAGVTWTRAQELAVEGHQAEVCSSWVDHTRPAPMSLGVDLGYPQAWQPAHHGLVNYPGIAPTAIGGCDAPIASVYSPVQNPRGVRCDAQDYAVGLMGRRPADGFANRPYSNVGVQYGLRALEAGVITPAQFADLNAKVGAHDIDYQAQAVRVAADPPARAAAYRSGWINTATGLASVPIIDIRIPDIDSIHHQYRSWVLRARLDAAHGGHGNQVIWFDSGRTPEQGVEAMAAWIAAVKADARPRSLAARIVEDRPGQITDLCRSRPGSGLTMAACTGVADGSVRMAAGEGPADDVLECRLVPLRREAYRARFSDAEWAKLQEAFPKGVCDYAAPGVDQGPTVPWLSYVGADGQVRYGGAPLDVHP